LRGILYRKTKMYNEALADFKKVNQLDAGNADSHYFAAQLLLVLEQNKYLAKRQLKKCLRINSAHEEAKKLVLQIS